MSQDKQSTPREKPSVEELERILALPSEALKIELNSDGSLRTRTAVEWVPIALRLTAEEWDKLPTDTRREVHDLAADLISKVVPSERGENAQRPLRRFRLIETGDGAEMKADPQGAYVLYSDFSSERQPINNDLTRLIDKMHDAVLDTDASGRPTGNLMDAWMELKTKIEP